MTSNPSFWVSLFQVFPFLFSLLQIMSWTCFFSVKPLTKCFVCPLCHIICCASISGLNQVVIVFLFMSLLQQMFQKDPYNMENMGRINKPTTYSPQQLYRDYDHPPSRYDVNSSVGGFPDSKYRNYDNLPYENSVSHYDQQPWSSYNQPQHSATNPQSYDLRTPYSDSSDPQYTPPLRIDEPPPQTGFDGRPRYGKPVPQGPIRHDDLPPSFPGSDLHYNQESPLNTYPSASRSPEPPTPRLAYNQGPTMQQKGYKPHQYDPPHANSESSLTPPPKAEAPSPSRDQLPEDDPAMRPQSVLTRVKMFENKRSVSVDRARDTGDSSNKVSSLYSCLNSIHRLNMYGFHCFLKCFHFSFTVLASWFTSESGGSDP